MHEEALEIILWKSILGVYEPKSEKSSSPSRSPMPITNHLAELLNMRRLHPGQRSTVARSVEDRSDQLGPVLGIFLPARLCGSATFGGHVGEGDDAIAPLAVVGLPVFVVTHTEERLLDLFDTGKLIDLFEQTRDEVASSLDDGAVLNAEGVLDDLGGIVLGG